jgi:hypothetical protein
MKRWIAGLILPGTLAIGFVHADTRETQQRNLDKYTPYLQAPVEDFAYWTLYRWQWVGAEKVVVWTTVKDAYLLTVETPCPRLEWAHGIGLTAKQSHRIGRRLDFVTFAGDRCRIEEIRPIDVSRVIRERHAGS